MIYEDAVCTGFRKPEIGSLTIQSLDLDSEVRKATVPAAFSKRRRQDTQILHPYLVKRLQAWLKARGDLEPDELLFPISARTGVEVTREDGTKLYRRGGGKNAKLPNGKSLPPVPERQTYQSS